MKNKAKILTRDSAQRGTKELFLREILLYAALMFVYVLIVSYIALLPFIKALKLPVWLIYCVSGGYVLWGLILAVQRASFLTKYWPIYKRVFWSSALSFLGFVPIFNMTVFLPLAGYLGYRALRLSVALPKKEGWKRIVAMVFALQVIITTILVWLFAFVVFLLISFRVIEV